MKAASPPRIESRSTPTMSSMAPAIQFNSAELLSATVPSGMEPGTYMLIVTNPDGDTDSLADAFEVRHRTSSDGGTDGGVDDPGKSSGCGCGHAGPVGGGLVLLLLVALVRRRW